MFGKVEKESSEREGDLRLRRGKKAFFESRRVRLEEVVEGEEEGEWFAGIEWKDLEEQRKERWRKINKSRYNRWCRMIMGTGIPGYLKKG